MSEASSLLVCSSTDGRAAQQLAQGFAPPFGHIHPSSGALSGALSLFLCEHVFSGPKPNVAVAIGAFADLEALDPAAARAGRCANWSVRYAPEKARTKRIRHPDIQSAFRMHSSGHLDMRCPDGRPDVGDVRTSWQTGHRVLCGTSLPALCAHSVLVPVFLARLTSPLIMAGNEYEMWHWLPPRGIQLATVIRETPPKHIAQNLCIWPRKGPKPRVGLISSATWLQFPSPQTHMGHVGPSARWSQVRIGTGVHSSSKRGLGEPTAFFFLWFLWPFFGRVDR